MRSLYARFSVLPKVGTCFVVFMLIAGSLPLSTQAQSSSDMSLSQLASLISSLQSIVNSLKSKVAALKGTSSISIAQAQSTGLIAAYSFNETSGTSAADSSGGNRIATVVNGPTWVVGKNANALNFDGSNDYASVPDQSILNFGTGDFTVSAWVYHRALQSYPIVGKFGTTGNGWRMYSSPSGRLTLDINTSGGFSQGGDVVTNTWQHLTAVRIGSSVKLYIDGVDRTNIGTGGTGDVSNASPFQIATTLKSASGDCCQRYVNAMIDDLRIYNRALTPAEIQTDMNAAVGGGMTLPPPPSDTQAPSTPTNLIATTVSASQINLSWTASTDNVGVAGYRIYRGGTQITTVTGTSYSNTGLSPSTGYSYTVAAYDAAGNVSNQSSSASATTQVSAPPPTGGSTVLGTLAAGMASGTFIELTGMGNWNNGAILNPAGCSGGDVITQYANTAVWNPIAKRFQFSGSPHAGCSGTNEKAIYYDDATNSWGTLPLPNNSGNDPRHSYGHNALNPATGEHYYTHYNSMGLQRLTNGASLWTDLASRTGSVQCCRAQAWFPDLNGGRLVHYDGDWGMQLYNPTTDSWTQVSQGNGGDGSGLPQLTADGYNVFAHYSGLCQCVVFGGGAGFYKINSNGSFTALSRSGGPANGALYVGPNGSSIVADPVTGKLLFITGSTMYEFDPTGIGSWRTMSVTVPSFFSGAGSTAESLISAPISDYGVVMYVKHDDSSTGRVYLYKHSTSTPPPSDTQAPTAPTNLLASAISTSQINLSWSASTDNIGVTGYRVERCTGSSCTNFVQISTLITNSYNDIGLTAGTAYRYQVRAVDAANNFSGYSATVSVMTQTSMPPPMGDFAARCSTAGVIRCFGFDSVSDLGGTYGSNFGSFNNGATSNGVYLPNTNGLCGSSQCPAIDAMTFASGSGSMKFTIPSNSGAGAAGQWFTNFSPDLTTQFGAGGEFWIQWRQRFDTNFVTNRYTGGDGEGPKQLDVSGGDLTGCTPSSSANCRGSNVDIETVIQNLQQRGYAQMYGYIDEGGGAQQYRQFLETLNGDYKFQNARPSPYCLYSMGSNWVALGGTCIGYYPNEWMTFKVHMKLGPQVGNSWIGSQVELWIGREGQISQPAISWTGNLGASNNKYGKVWFFPYITNKNASQVHPTAYTWYDDLIISHNNIADPSTSPGQVLVGDLNLDRIVNSLDWSLMNAAWSTNNATADLNRDGIVNSLDFSLLNSNWGRTI